MDAREYGSKLEIWDTYMKAFDQEASLPLQSFQCTQTLWKSEGRCLFASSQHCSPECGPCQGQLTLPNLADRDKSKDLISGKGFRKEELRWVSSS